MSLRTPLVLAGRQTLDNMVDGPDMRDAVAGWSRPMVLEIVTLKSGPGGDAVESDRSFPTDGFLAATTARELDIKEDGSGTRKWGYWKLHTLQDPALEVGDRLVIDGKRYKALTSQNRGQHGFWVYGLREDFKP